MEIKPEEVRQTLKEEIQSLETDVDYREEGTVLEVGDGIAQVYGLKNVRASELVEFENGVKGLALNLDEGRLGVVIIGPEKGIHEGDRVQRTGRVISVPVGPQLCGRVVNALGEAVDDAGQIDTEESFEVERDAPGLQARKPVEEPLQTGLKAIDSLTPLGRGQRELIVGDRQTGKSAIGVDTILNQKDNDVKCIYVAIGQKKAQVAELINKWEEAGAMEYTTVVLASASAPVAERYIAPYAGCSMAEYFRDNGEDALIVYDDLSKHAVAYREISLLLRRPPGREAFPGDVFYLHSRLLERAAKLDEEHGGGSLTALPVVETQAGDVSAYIPTNVISITDGQIYLDPELFNEGIRPAIDVGVSVSRIGGEAQNEAMKEIAGSLHLELAQYREKESFAQFGTELDEETRKQLTRGERLMEILKQPQFNPLPVGEQLLILYGGVNGFLDRLSVEDVQNFEELLLREARAEHTDLLEKLESEEGLTEELESELEELINGCLEQMS